MNFISNNETIRNDIFGFTKTPFRHAPAKPYLNDQRQTFMQELLAFSQRRGIAAVAGEPGSGKTALIRYFSESLSKNNHKIIYNPFTNSSDNDLLRSLCTAFEIDPFFHRNRTIEALQQRIRELGSINPVVVLDETQNASHSLLETVRLLTNDEFDSRNRLSLILIGTEDLFRELKKKRNESLRQRVTLYCRVTELTEKETSSYMRHCLEQAGTQQQIFKEEAIKLIYDVSHGRMRSINKMAAAALEAASRDLSPTVELKHVHHAEKISILPAQEIFIGADF
jgi:general secretion pathway protein A